MRAFSGVDILEEYAGLAGFLLWTLFRDAEIISTALALSGCSLWGDSAVQNTRRTYVSELEDTEFGPIKPALHSLAALVAPTPPDVRLLAGDCGTIAGWSEMKNKLGTAVEYAQVASFAEPDSATHAVRAARILRMRAEYERALTWFDHSIITARRTKDWESYAQAYSGIGCLYMQRGNYRRARQMLRRSLRTALRHSLPERAGAAYHNLFAVEASVGDWPLAEQYAERALDSYPQGSRGLPRLARDLAFRWIQRGYFERALPLAREALVHFVAPADRALVLSDIARAAAGCAELEVFEDAWAQAYTLSRQENLDPFAVDVLLNLAHAAASRRDATRGNMAAQRAIELARARKQGEFQLEAEAILAGLQAEMAALPQAASQPLEGSQAEQWIVHRFITVLRPRPAGT